jgi:hypothetical protein
MAQTKKTTNTGEMDRLISERIRDLPETHKRKILEYIEFLKIREDRSFIEYVNSRTRETIEARKRGEKFTSLQELQKEYV